MIKESITELLLPYPDREDRLVRVYVPEHNEGETFPVIYMTDGQNLFEDDNVAYGCWYTREAVKAQRKLTGKAAVIVGIHNDNPERESELTPASIGEVYEPEEVDKSIVPAGEIFDSFIINTVIPAVESRFPVKKGRENTAFCGSSCGGMMSFFTAMSHPDIFCAAGVFSPVFMFYSEDDLRSFILKSMKPEMPYLYIYTGAGDDLEQAIYKSVESTYDILLECYPSDLMNEIIMLDNIHHESAWEPIFGEFLHTFLNKLSNN